MPSLCKVWKSDLIQDRKFAARSSLSLSTATAVAAGAGASQRRVHPLTSIPNSGQTTLKDKLETKSNQLHSNDVHGALTTITRDRTDSDNSKSAATANSLLNEEDKENSKSNASSISIATNSNEPKAHNRPKKKKRMTLDAYFVRPPPSKNGNETSDDDDDDDDEDYTELHHESSKKKQRKILTLNENAKPLHVRIPFIDNEKPVDVTIVSHCISNKYIDVNEPLALSGDVLYPASSRSAIERFLPGFGRYIH